MDRERLIFKTYLKIPYTVDIEAYPRAESEDGLLKIYFSDEEDIVRMACYGEEVGIPIDIIEKKIKEFNLTWSEHESVMSFFYDNNSCDNEDYIIIPYDEIYFSTGIRDIMGCMIFEGDYVSVDFNLEDNIPSDYFENKCEVVWHLGAFRLKYSEDKYLPLDIGFYSVPYSRISVIETKLKESKEILV